MVRKSRDETRPSRRRRSAPGSGWNPVQGLPAVRSGSPGGGGVSERLQRQTASREPQPRSGEDRRPPAAWRSSRPGHSWGSNPIAEPSGRRAPVKAACRRREALTGAIRPHRERRGWRPLGTMRTTYPRAFQAGVSAPLGGGSRYDTRVSTGNPGLCLVVALTSRMNGSLIRGYSAASWPALNHTSSARLVTAVNLRRGSTLPVPPWRVAVRRPN